MELQIINQQEVLGKDFTIYGTLEEPLFLAKDVADWIEQDEVAWIQKKPYDEVRGLQKYSLKL